jgi:F0F1-type ATP synthase assembly protein I
MADQLPKSRQLGYVIAISQVGLEMVAPIGLGVGLDVWLGTLPWISIVGVLLGFFGGMSHLMVLVNRMDKAEKSEPSTPPEEPK